MVSTVSRALSRKVSDEVAKLIVDFAGEVLPPGVSKGDWLRVLTGGDECFVPAAHPSELRRQVEEYMRVLGKGEWRLGGEYLFREFARTPDLLTRLADSGLEVNLRRMTARRREWRLSRVQILEVNRSGTAFRHTTVEAPYWCKIADVVELYAQLNVFHDRSV